MNDDQKQQYRAYVSYHWDMYKDLTNEAVMFASPEKSIYKTEETNMSSLNLKNKLMYKINSLDTGISAVRNRMFVVGSLDNLGRFSMSEYPVSHYDRNSAKAEAARLAKINPGKVFVYMQLAGGEVAPTACTSF